MSLRLRAMTKRRKFILSSFILAVCLLVTQYIPVDFRFIGVAILFGISYAVSAWALSEDLKGIEWGTIIPVPALYSASVALFYYLLPQNTLARLLVLTIFGVGMYAVYLTSNIYSVAATRTIQLVRAAHAVGFVMTLLTLVLFFNTIYSLHLDWWANGPLVGLVSLPLVLSALWSVKLEERVSVKIIRYTILIILGLVEVATAISFLPLTVWVSSLFTATVAYVGLGILQHDLSERLFERTLQEYIGIGIFVLLATMLVTRWK